MYIIIADKRYPVTRRKVYTEKTIYTGVTPEPETVSGEIVMYRDDGFEMSRDNVSNYERHEYNGDILTLTNEPVPPPPPPEPPDPPEPEETTEDLLLEMAADHEERICMLELGI